MKKILIALMLVPFAAIASEKSYKLPKTYVTECGACHTAFPAEFLTQEARTGLLANLNKHYGDNASLDAATLKEINTYFATAPVYRKATTTNDFRITGDSWFKREHRRETAKSLVNCSECHKQADKGVYDEPR